MRQGPGHSWEEVLETNAGGFLAYELEKLQPLADAIRGGIDPDFGRIVWG